jgi:hypothetical protein
MKHAARLAISLVIAWMVASSLSARPNGARSGSGGQGGHASSGGHAGFSSGGAGHSAGHAVAHSMGRLFGGGHSKRSTSTPDLDPFTSAGAARPKGRKPSGSWVMTTGSPFHHHHHGFGNDFPFGNRLPFFPHNGFGCEGLGFSHRRFFGNELNCFSGGFVFDPFFLDDFSSGFAGDAAGNERDNPAAASLAAMEEEADADAEAMASATYLPQNESGGPAETLNAGLGLPTDANRDQDFTLLQLRDGSQYGLTYYRIDGDELHYRTTYGGQGSVKLDRIDAPKTKQLNAERGIVFTLKPESR